ncbi:MAG TPA: S8 family serine peptidase [Blastocatellia bacterium]|nr:S8 family serine peptidase [Blastocatellia bacterium]
MKKGLLVSLAAIGAFVLTSAAGANSRFFLQNATGDDHHRTIKTANAERSAAAVNARSYRSPGKLRKVVIAADDQPALADARSAGAIEISDYGTFKLFAMDDDALEVMSKQPGVEPLTPSPDRPINRSSLAVRDDFNVLLLRSGAIDTMAADADGAFAGFGRAAVAQSSGFEGKGKTGGSGLRLIQFVGPIKREWLDALRASGLEPIAYVPNNGYLVRGSDSSSARLMSLASAGENFVQWEGPFAREQKIHPRLLERMREQPGAQVIVTLQVARASRSRDKDDIKAAKKIASEVYGGAYDVLNFTNLRVKVDAGRIAEIADLPSVVNVEPWNPPQLFDERSAQIIAGNLTSDGKSANGPGYMSWLQAHGFASNFGFAIDVSDTGLDRGSIAADKLHPDFLDSNRQSRVIYARDYTSELDPGDVQGHGTLNLSVAGGSNIAATARDSSGYSYGIGIAPFAQLGSSKIFQSGGPFDLIEPFTTLISDAYRSGARVSSNSWGDISNSYTIDAQEYDARTRDAMPSEPGNQEIPICFAAGNAGGTNRIGAPGTAKNVISVAASESSRKDGIDGCGVEDSESDSVMDIAFFSSGGPLADGRLKPDITAPGTHIEGAATQNPDFDGSGVCGADLSNFFFPKGQTLYTWSSGTSHSTPQVAGAAALARQFFLNRGEEPSAALIKALLVNTTTYMTGASAGGNLPQKRQGWGLLNLNRAFDATPKIFVNQSNTFTSSGQEFVLTGEVKDSTQPVRVTLAWTDAPGFSGAAPWVNDLNLEVAINGQVYCGNDFIGQESQPGSGADAKNNVEAVWLPAGTVGAFVVRVRAANIAGDGVPGNGDSTDQDFALAVYNGEAKQAPVAELRGVTISGGADAFADPGETVSMTISLGDFSPVALSGGRGVVSTKATGINITTSAADFPTIAQGEARDNLTPFAFSIDRSVACGTVIGFTLDVTSGGSVSRVPFKVMVGRAQPAEFFADDVEAGQAKWTHGSAIKKKKKKEPVDTWSVSTKRFRSGGSSWFSSDPGKLADAHLDSVPITLPADGRDLQLVFYHTFEFERGAFDGGLIEISTGGGFEDLGPKIIQGGYNDVIWEFSSTNPLAGKSAWVEGRLGQFQQVVVDLSSFAGKTVTIRFRLVTDVDGKGLGWYLDDLSLRGNRISCSPVALQ